MLLWIHATAAPPVLTTDLGWVHRCTRTVAVGLLLGLPGLPAVQAKSAGSAGSADASGCRPNPAALSGLPDRLSASSQMAPTVAQRGGKEGEGQHNAWPLLLLSADLA